MIRNVETDYYTQGVVERQLNCCK